MISIPEAVALPDMDEILSSERLREIVHDAIIDAASGKAAPEAPPEQYMLMGHNAGIHVRAGAAKAVAELVANSALLAGPLSALNARLEAALAEAMSLEEESRKLAKTLSERSSRLSADAPVAVAAGDAAPSAPVCGLADPAPADALPEATAATDETEAAQIPDVIAAAPAPAAPSPDEEDSEPVFVCGEEVKFTSRTPAAFRRYLRELVAAMEKGPVAPSEAHAMARRNGYEAIHTTISAQTEAYLGKRLLRWKDGSKRWWGLSGGQKP